MVSAIERATLNTQQPVNQEFWLANSSDFDKIKI
jgi:hypothetical protein